MINIKEEKAFIDNFKIYNSRTGVIQITPDKTGTVNIEVAKSTGTAENPSYDFENKITSSLSIKERSKIAKMIDDFDRDTYKIPEARYVEKSIYIDVKPVTFNHHKSSKPKNISFQRQIYNGDKQLRKKQLTITLELLDKTSAYSKHMQSVDEEDFLIIRDIFKESIIRESFYNVDSYNDQEIFELSIKGASKTFKIKLPKSIQAGDLVKMKDGSIRILGREFIKTSNSWKIYAENK